MQLQHQQQLDIQLESNNNVNNNNNNDNNMKGGGVETYIVCEFRNGGAFLAAKKHWEDSNLTKDTIFVSNADLNTLS